MKKDLKKQYEAPEVELVTFDFKDSIATSGVSLFEEIWGGGTDV